MAAGNPTGGILDDVRYDLQRMHETWMELFFPRQRAAGSSVLGKWKPTSTRERATYNSWFYLGVPVIALVYPFVLLGVVLRFQSRRLDSAALRLGSVGVFLLLAVVWGGLTALAHLRFSTEGFIAVGAASAVAVLSALLALSFRGLGGRGTTVILAYPFGMTSLFLPPVVAALYSPTVAAEVFPRSESIAIWLLDNPLSFADVDRYLRRTYELEGVAFAAMWFGLSVPVGWLLGVLVTLADLVRPTASASSDDE